MIPATIVYEDDSVVVQVDDDNYHIWVDNNSVDVHISDVILKEVFEYVTEEDEVYDIEVDTSVPNVTYVGQALPGTSSSVASWRVKKITETSTGSSVDWANGSAEFVHVWDDRLAFTYGP